jgi:hypothetical protein
MSYLTNAARVSAAAALLLAAAPSFSASVVYGTGAVALGATTYTQDFNTLATGPATTTQTSSVLPTGWRVSESGDNGNGTYGVSSGNTNTGNVYSYGSANSTDRALGTLRSGNLAPSIGAIFTNSTGSTITDLLFAFTGEQWRNGNASIDTLAFQYSLTSTNIADALGSAAWTNLTGLNFVSPSNGVVGALDGNAAANSIFRTSTLSNLALSSGSSFAIRWIDTDPNNADDGLAIDNFSVSATNAPVAAVPEPATWSLMLAGFGMIGFGLRRRSRVKTTVNYA